MIMIMIMMIVPPGLRAPAPAFLQPFLSSSPLGPSLAGPALAVSGTILCYFAFSRVGRFNVFRGFGVLHNMILYYVI